MIELDPKLALAYSNRAAAYRNKGDYDRAIADATKAIELDPEIRRRLQQPRQRLPGQG